MQMGPKEIAVEYRTAANKNKQITVLAELNQVAERKIAEILAAEGEDLPKKWQELLQKPGRRSRKFPDPVGADAPGGPHSRESPVVSREEAEPEPMPDGGTSGGRPLQAAAATDRDIFDAVATLLPEAEPDKNPHREAKQIWLDGIGPTPEFVKLRPRATHLISAAELLREACRMLTSALDLEPEKYHAYSCGVLDLVHKLLEEGV